MDANGHGIDVGWISRNLGGYRLSRLRLLLGHATGPGSIASSVSEANGWIECVKYILLYQGISGSWRAAGRGSKAHRRAAHIQVQNIRGTRGGDRARGM